MITRALISSYPITDTLSAAGPFILHVPFIKFLCSAPISN